MQDNETSADRRAYMVNVATNGRWGMAGMAAISLYIDRPLLAFSFVLIILASHLAEAILVRRFMPLVYAVIACWGAVAVMGLAVVLVWR